MSVPYTSEATFREEVLESPVPVVVDVTADWCGPCRAMAPIVEALATERDDVRVLKLDGDKDMSLAQAFDVRGFPTFLVFDCGVDRGRINGAMPKQRLSDAIDQILAGVRA